MDCATVSVDNDDGYCTELSRKTPVARKTYRCSECHDVIRPGEKYERTATVFYGEFEEYKTCLDCVSIRKVFFSHGWMWTTLIDDMENHISECSGIISESAIARLNAGGRAMVCDMLQEYWKYYEDEELES